MSGALSLKKGQGVKTKRTQTQLKQPFLGNKLHLFFVPAKNENVPSSDKFPLKPRGEHNTKNHLFHGRQTATPSFVHPRVPPKSKFGPSARVLHVEAVPRPLPPLPGHAPRRRGRGPGPRPRNPLPMGQNSTRPQILVLGMTRSLGSILGLLGTHF